MSQRELSIGTAVCRASGCGREAAREELEETPRKFREKEQRALRERIEETARDWRSTANQLETVNRDLISKGQDPELYLDPATTGTMTEYEAAVFNEREALRFIRETPEYHACPENMVVLFGYLQRNGISQIVSAESLRAAFRRLDTYGLLERPPAPTSASVDYRPVEIRIAPAEPLQESESMVGFDLRTGEQREYTKYEIDRMGSEEFRRVFRLFGDRAPLTPHHAAF
ncbi:MAG: hypothetical protein V4555_05325 [Acidobacteriota bacterium]